MSEPTAPPLPPDLPVASTVSNEDENIPVVEDLCCCPDSINRAPEEVIRNFDKNSDITPIPKEVAQVSFTFEQAYDAFHIFYVL